MLIGVMFGIAGPMMMKLFKQCTMSESEYRHKMEEMEMVEMRELMKDREYTEEAGKILIPAGV